MFENLFEEAESIIKQNLDEETDKYILESDNLEDEIELAEGLEEILYVDDYEEIIVEGIEDMEVLGFMEYEEIDLDDDYEETESGEEVDDSEEVDTFEELITPDENSVTSEEDDEDLEDWFEESWIFELED